MPMCSKCGLEIKFIQTKKKKWMPVDPGLVDFNEARKENSSIKFIVNGAGETITRGLSEKGYIPHWFTCLDPNFFSNQYKSKTDR